MKKLLAITLSILMAFSVAACGTNVNTSGKALDTAMVATQNGDVTALQNVLSSTGTSSIDEDIYLSILGKMTYEIGKAKTSGKTAKVLITITNLDMQTILTNYPTEVIKNLSNSNFDGDAYIKNTLVAEDAATITLTATVPMVKTDGVWNVDTTSDITEFSNALMSGLNGYAQSITPEKFLGAAMVALKNGDFATYKSIQPVDTSNTNASDQETFSTVFKKMTYEMSNAVITDNTAKVPVSITTIDMKTIMTNYLTTAFSNLFNKDFDADAYLKEAMAAEDAKTATLTATVPMIKTDGVWKVDSSADTTEFVNAISGGLYDYAKEMSSAFS